ncbi:hypothetical protein [Mycetocola reblochoni]|uniref:Uncharacterized protein n=1 Tax=Mycetocola reblochoni REB411 TaxID=1255698 RepID=A0A1R4IN77_9MICO|nr:hypothetical protein [Mycetocola reblochoni]SJN21330.1 hypothetical protein FM119_02735 [Mycetocola reblochoni REB411]
MSDTTPDPRELPDGSDQDGTTTGEEDTASGGAPAEPDENAAD